MKTIAIFLAIAFSASAWAAEPADSMPRRPQAAGSRFTVNADLSVRPGGDYYITKDDETVEQGSTGSFTKASVRASYAVYTKGTTRITTALRYAHLHQHFRSDERLVDYGFVTAAHHQFAANVMGMTRQQLWGKPLVLVGMASVDFSQYGYERWTAMATAMLMLKQTRQTQFGIGLLGMVNTFSKIPVFAIFTYRHVFSPQWTLNLTLPKFQMEYRPSKADMIALGAGIDADSYYIRPGSEDLPENVRYSRSNINIGPTYEHRFAGGFTLTAEAGAQVIMTDRIYRHSSSQELATMHEKTKPYCRISLQKGF